MIYVCQMEHHSKMVNIESKNTKIKIHIHLYPKTGTCFGWGCWPGVCPPQENIWKSSNIEPDSYTYSSITFFGHVMMFDCFLGDRQDERVHIHFHVHGGELNVQIIHSLKHRYWNRGLNDNLTW